MSLEMSTDKAICTKCGTAYSRRKSFFPVSYALLHKGTGYLPVCKTCVEGLYSTYLSQCNDPAMAIRQICRKFDLFWSQKIYDAVSQKSTSRSILSQYLTRVHTLNYAGKSYDDTLLAEGTLWSFGESQESQSSNYESDVVLTVDVPDSIGEDVIDFWGPGYTPEMYATLEQRRKYWTDRLPHGDSLDVGTEAIIKQICSTELDINRNRASGKNVDRSVASLLSLLKQASLTPDKQKDDSDSSLAETPLGVWLYRYENELPLPEVDPSLKDVNHIQKYVFTWLGHLCKMLGIKNGYAQLYEDEISKWRVVRPEYDDEDDESMMYDIFNENTDTEEGSKDS